MAEDLSVHFFRGFLQSLVSPTERVRLFEGHPGRYLPMHNMDALMGELYKVARQMIAASVLQMLGPNHLYI